MTDLETLREEYKHLIFYCYPHHFQEVLDKLFDLAEKQEKALEYYAGDYNGKEGSMWHEDRFFIMDKLGSTHSADGPKVAREALKKIKGME